MHEATGQSYKIYAHPAAALETITAISGTGQKIVKIETQINDLKKYKIRVKIYGSSGYMRISNFQIRMFLSDFEAPSQVFLDKEGAEYGSWITGRGHAAGNLIENPIHIIESIARDEMGLDNSSIDVTAFDTAATARSGMKYAFQLLERKPARDILNDLALQCGAFLWWDEQDRLTVKVFDATAKFPNSRTDIPANLDIFSTGLPANGAFTQHPIIEYPDDFISRVPLDDVANDFVINYAKNYATGEYSKTLTVNKDGHNLSNSTLGAILKGLCVASEAAIQTRNTYTLDAWAIRDDATAEALMQHLVTRKYRRWTVLHFVGGFDCLPFEPGDFVNVRDARISDLYGVARANRKKWMIVKLNPDLNRDRYDLTLIEVD
jgi:hypothetical protein